MHWVIKMHDSPPAVNTTLSALWGSQLKPLHLHKVLWSVHAFPFAAGQGAGPVMLLCWVLSMGAQHTPPNCCAVLQRWLHSAHSCIWELKYGFAIKRCSMQQQTYYQYAPDRPPDDLRRLSQGNDSMTSTLCTSARQPGASPPPPHLSPPWPCWYWKVQVRQSFFSIFWLPYGKLGLSSPEFYHHFCRKEKVLLWEAVRVFPSLVSLLISHKPDVKLLDASTPKYLGELRSKYESLCVFKWSKQALSVRYLLATAFLSEKEMVRKGGGGAKTAKLESSHENGALRA